MRVRSSGELTSPLDGARLILTAWGQTVLESRHAQTSGEGAISPGSIWAETDYTELSGDENFQSGESLLLSLVHYRRRRPLVLKVTGIQPVPIYNPVGASPELEDASRLELFLANSLLRCGESYLLRDIVQLADPDPEIETNYLGDHETGVYVGVPKIAIELALSTLRIE